jgi:hypothetical protein
MKLWRCRRARRRVENDPEELAAACRKFLRRTEDVIPTARTYPGGMQALLQARTDAADLLVWAVNGPGRETVRDGRLRALRTVRAGLGALERRAG